MKNRIDTILQESIKKNLKRALIESAQPNGPEDMLNWLNGLKESIEEKTQDFMYDLNDIVGFSIKRLSSVYNDFDETFGDVIYQKVDEEYLDGSVDYTFLTTVDGSDAAWEEEDSPALELEQRTFEFGGRYPNGVSVDLRPTKQGLMLTLSVVLFDANSMPKIYVDFLNSADERLGLIKSNDE